MGARLGFRFDRRTPRGRQHSTAHERLELMTFLPFAPARPSEPRCPRIGRSRASRARRFALVRLTYSVQKLSSLVAIASFKCPETQDVFEGTRGARFANLRSVLERKLQMLDAAVSLNDLRIPPANRLEALSKDRAGQHSIRVNDQFRLCFRWTAGGPADVECVDSH